MATVIQQPETSCFSSMLRDIVFGTTAESGAVTLAVQYGGVSHSLLAETLYADADGHITLTDLPSLVEPYARLHPQMTLTCTLDCTAGNDGTVSISPVSVVYCACEIGVATDAASFLEGHFLTLLDGRRYTAVGRSELLSAYGGAYSGTPPATAATFTVMAKVLTASGRIDVMTQTQYVLPCNIEGLQAGQLLLYQFDASPRRLCGLLEIGEDQLLDYTVWMGIRSQDYAVVSDERAPEPSLIFRNSFGVTEILHCCGKLSKESKFDRKSARVNGRLRNYSITEGRQFSANTGWLSDAMAMWAVDLFRSHEVQLWTEASGAGREVVITDSKSVMTNADGDMTSYEFTYTYAQRNHNVMRLPNLYGRLHTTPYNTIYN